MWWSNKNELYFDTVKIYSHNQEILKNLIYVVYLFSLNYIGPKFVMAMTGASEIHERTFMVVYKMMQNE